MLKVNHQVQPKVNHQVQLRVNHQVPLKVSHQVPLKVSHQVPLKVSHQVRLLQVVVYIQINPCVMRCLVFGPLMVVKAAAKAAVVKVKAKAAVVKVKAKAAVVKVKAKAAVVLVGLVVTHHLVLAVHLLLQQLQVLAVALHPAVVRPPALAVVHLLHPAAVHLLVPAVVPVHQVPVPAAHLQVPLAVVHPPVPAPVVLQPEALQQLLLPMRQLMKHAQQFVMIAEPVKRVILFVSALMVQLKPPPRPVINNPE